MYNAAMFYVYRVRLLVKIVRDEMRSPTDPMDSSGGNPSLQHCLFVFRQKNKRYTGQLARQTLAIATGQAYLGIDNTNGDKAHLQRLLMKHEGLILLTPTGYINALASSVKGTTALVSILISIAAVIVSIIALRHK